MVDPRKLKERATEAFQKGKFVKAAEAYAEYCKADPKDLQARLRMGDAWSKGGKKEKAIESYTWAAEGFAKDGFLPRAIAASKLILELDPSHHGVQKMLADLYARKTNVPAASGGPSRPGSLRVETKIDMQTSAVGFAHRKGAIELDAKPVSQAKPLPKPQVPPSPMNRKDAIDLPEYEVPGLETGSASGSVSVPMATRGPSPLRREDAIELVEEEAGRDGPAQLHETSLELDVSMTGAQRLPLVAPSSGRVELEIEVPIEGVEIPGPTAESFELKVEAPSESFELEVEAPARPVAKKGPQLALEEPPEEIDVVEVEGSDELKVVEPAPLIHKPPPRPTLEVLDEPVTGVLEMLAEPPMPVARQEGPRPSRHEAAGEKSGSFSAPPGLKPKRPAETPPVAQPQAAAPVTADLPIAPGESPRIWLPGNFADLEGVAPEAAISATTVLEPRAENLTDLERGLQIFASFDAEDFRAPQPTIASPVAPMVPVPVPVAPRRTFTELELEGDSLLHAVEAAAAVGVQQRGESADDGSEEAMEMPDDERLAPGELPKIPLFSDLPPDAFIALFERCPLKRVEPGEIVIQQGSLGDSFYVICSGSVRVFRMDAEQRREIATLEEGAFFGEMALLSGAARTASVEAATEDTQLLEISAPILTELSHRYPQVATALKKFCRQRLLSNLMNSSPLFQPFSRNDRRDLVQRFRSRDVQKGGVLIMEGHRSDGMYVILSGEVEVRVGPTQVASLKEGDVFGEMSLLTKANATASVAASKHTSLLRLPREDFDLIIMSHPQVLVLVSELTDSRTKQNAAIASHQPARGDAAPMV